MFFFSGLQVLMDHCNYFDTVTTKSHKNKNFHFFHYLNLTWNHFWQREKFNLCSTKDSERLLRSAQLLSHVQLFATPWTVAPPGFSVHGDCPGKNTGVGSHSLRQGIFPNQGSNSGLLHCRQSLYHLNHQGSPRILEQAAYPFCRGSS